MTHFMSAFFFRGLPKINHVYWLLQKNLKNRYVMINRSVDKYHSEFTVSQRSRSKVGGLLLFYYYCP